jgi:hypothetical protein
MSERDALPVVAAAVAIPVAVNRRARPDRRQLTLRSVLYGSLRPRRRNARRMADGAVHIVDWHEAHLLAVSITILLLCSADAWLTLNLLELGASELNPFMAALIYHDLTAFTAAKMALTGGGVVTLVMLSRVRVAGLLRVRHLLYGILIGYGWLIAYELKLLFPH